MTPDIIERAEIHWVDLDTRFSTAPRLLPVSGKPCAAPADPAPKVIKVTQIRIPRVHVPRRAVKTYVPHERAATYQPRKPKEQFSPVALAPCVVDEGQHEWIPFSARAARCMKCRRVVVKHMIPGKVELTRRPKTGRLHLPECTDPRGHADPLAMDGKRKNGAQRLKCKRCNGTRNATAEELAERAANPRVVVYKTPLPKPTGERTLLPDCGHDKFRKIGTDRYGRKRKRCTVEGCGRTMIVDG
jgi:hypothetical protein